MLKVVENLGVSYLRGNECYKTKLEAELRKLKFPYRVSENQKSSFSRTLFPLHHAGILNRSRDDEILLTTLLSCCQRCFPWPVSISFFRTTSSATVLRLLS